jgi:hypothetical protein
MRSTRFVLAGLTAVAFAACNSSDTMNDTTPLDNTSINADVASAAADGFAEDVDVMVGMDGRVGNTSTDAMLLGPGGYRPHLTGCSFANGAFTCPDTNRAGLTITRTITLLDASGATQSAYDSVTTASIHIVADIAGDATHGPWSATVARHRDLTVTGLAGAETSRTVNGTGNETVSRSRVTRNDSTRSYDIAGNSTITDVVMPVRSGDGGNGWPTSGTITRTMTITLTSGQNAGKTVTRTVTITFNGTSSATASVDGSSFTIDLEGHTAVAR